MNESNPAAITGAPQQPQQPQQPPTPAPQPVVSAPQQPVQAAVSVQAFDPVSAFRSFRERIVGFAAVGADGLEAACALLDEISRTGRQLVEQMRGASVMDTTVMSALDVEREELSRLALFDGAAASPPGQPIAAAAQGPLTQDVSQHSERTGFTRVPPATVQAMGWKHVLAELALRFLNEFLTGGRSPVQ